VNHETSVVTASMLEAGFRELGLAGGMFVEVHSSLSSFGFVEGGARTVIDAIKNIVTPNGAIVMTSFPVTQPLELTDLDKARGLIFKIRVLDPDSDERTGMGIISDTFRKDPGVLTGTGPHRVSAWGAEAEKNAEGLSNLHEHDGVALLLGVDIYRLTSMHYVENGMPEEIAKCFSAPEEIRKIYPENEWYVETGTAPEKAWYKIQDQAYARGFIKDRMIGNAKCMFLKVNDVIGLYRRALDTDPLGLYGLAKKPRPAAR